MVQINTTSQAIGRVVLVEVRAQVVSTDSLSLLSDGVVSCSVSIVSDSVTIAVSKNAPMHK